MPALKDFSNRDLDRRFRWDLLVAVLLAVIPMLAGGIYAYAQLTSDVEDNSQVNVEQSKEIKHIRDSQEETKEDISEIRTSVAVIQNDLKNVDKDLEEIKQLLRERAQ